MPDEEVLAEDASHYEISLTAGQAFVAFVLLLLSLGASFAFGLVIGKGQAEERLAGKHDAAVISEASASGTRSAAEAGMAKKAGAQPPPAESGSMAPVVDEAVPAAARKPTAQPVAGRAGPSSGAPETKAATPAAGAKVSLKGADGNGAVPEGPVFAQLMSMTDQKAAEALAAKLIDNGFTSAYVERGATEKGTMYRVRVKFSSEGEARSAEPRLRQFSKDVWITRQP
jgi:SPOR domain